jgi:hypothetical protein
MSHSRTFLSDVPKPVNQKEISWDVIPAIAPHEKSRRSADEQAIKPSMLAGTQKALPSGLFHGVDDRFPSLS